MKIKKVEIGDESASPDCENMPPRLHFEEARYAPLVVSRAYMTKHQPQPGGYYVVYPDGYESFSPAEAFESGYTLTDHGATQQEATAS